MAGLNMDMHGGGFGTGDATAAQHVRLAGGGTAAPIAPVQAHHRDDLLIGEVIDIAGSASRILLDASALQGLSTSNDPSVAMAGQVGAQVKVRVGNVWLLASVRNQRQDRKAGSILANIDFLGEGTEEKLTGKLHAFRRGVTRYPVPGALVEVWQAGPDGEVLRLGGDDGCVLSTSSLPGLDDRVWRGPVARLVWSLGDRSRSRWTLPDETDVWAAGSTSPLEEDLA